MMDNNEIFNNQEYRGSVEDIKTHKTEIDTKLDIFSSDIPCLDWLDCNHNCNKSNCLIDSSYPIIFTRIICRNSKQKREILGHISDFSQLVVGTSWFVLEDFSDYNKITVIEFFGYCNGSFVKTIYNNKDMKSIISNKLDISKCGDFDILNIKRMEGKFTSHLDVIIKSLLEDEQSYNYSNNNGIILNGHIKSQENEVFNKYKDKMDTSFEKLDSKLSLQTYSPSSIVFIVNISCEDISKYIERIEDVFVKSWIMNEDIRQEIIDCDGLPFLAMLIPRLDLVDGGEMLSKNQLIMLHMFTSVSEYALVTSTTIWNDYLVLLSNIGSSCEYTTNKLIYSTENSIFDGSIPLMSDSESSGNGEICNKRNESSSENIINRTSMVSSLSTSSKGNDNSNYLSSTDAESCLTSANCSTEEILDRTTSIGFDSHFMNINLLLVRRLSDICFWETGLINEDDVIAASNLRKGIFINNSIDRNMIDSMELNIKDDHNADIYSVHFPKHSLLNNGIPVVKCKKFKYSMDHLKKILAESVTDDIYSFSGDLSGIDNRSDDSEKNNLSLNCRINKGNRLSNLHIAAYSQFCQIHKLMGVIKLFKHNSNNQDIWLFREFISDLIPHVSFDNLCKQGEQHIQDDKLDTHSLEECNFQRKQIAVYLVGDFNNWNKTSHPMVLETEDTYSQRNQIYSNYPVIPDFMKGYVYSIVISSEEFSENKEGSFRIRIILKDNCTGEELETYRLLSYSKRLSKHGDLINFVIPNNPLEILFKNRDDKDKSDNYRTKDINIRCTNMESEDYIEMPNPIPKCVLKNNVIESPYTSIAILNSLIENIRKSPLFVYEVHIGLSTGNSNNIGSYRSFAENILPRVSRIGYNCILFIGLLEHYPYNLRGYFNYNYFSPSNIYGNLQDFLYLVSECHRRGVIVLTDLNLTYGDITSYNALVCSRNESQTHNYDFKKNHYKQNNEMKEQPQNIQNEDLDSNYISKLFLNESQTNISPFIATNIGTISPYYLQNDPNIVSPYNIYHKQVAPLNLGYIPMLAIILSSIHYLMTELHIDGFRFYILPTEEETAEYPNGSVIRLVNDLVHSIKPYGITISHEISLPNTKPSFELTIPIESGGLGFDYVWDSSISCALKHIALINWQNLNLKRDILSIFEEDTIRIELSRPRRAISTRLSAKLLKDSDLCNIRRIYSLESLETNIASQNPLRIAMFSWESLHTHAVGGVAPHVSELSAGLVHFGHEVHLFTRATTSVYVVRICDGVIYHECPFQLHSDFVTEITNMCNSFVYYMQLWESGLTNVPVGVPKNGFKFNICHCHDWLAAPVLTSLRRIGNNGRTTFLTIHSTEYGRCGNQSYGGQSRCIADIEREACHTANRLICVSGVLADEVCRLYGVNRNKIQVIYNGIFCETFDRVHVNDPGEVKRRYHIGPMDPTFLCVARMVVQKGVDLLIEAVPGVLKYRSDAKFIIAGDGHQKDEIERRSHQLGIHNSVRFVGKQCGDELIRLYKACDAIVVPSRNEPFGIVVLEGWSAGKPVVATTSGGPRDFLSPNVDGYLVDPNKDSIAWGCCEILKNFEHSRWMGSRGRVKAAFSFSWNTIARLTSNLYFEQCNILDVCPSLNLDIREPFILQCLGQDALHHHMTVFDNFEKSCNGLRSLKLSNLTMMAFNRFGLLHSMGSEFGNPDTFDFPRPNNNFNRSRSFCNWDLADNKGLKFKHIEFFNASLIRFEKLMNWTFISKSSNLSKLSHQSLANYNLREIETNSCIKQGYNLNTPYLYSNTSQASSNGLPSTDCETLSLDEIKHCELDHMMKKVQQEINKCIYRTCTSACCDITANKPCITLCHEEDKVLIVERANCTFVFNYSGNYYSNYGFGITNRKIQTIILDTEDERFGGTKINTKSFNKVNYTEGFNLYLKGNGNEYHFNNQRTIDPQHFRQTIFLDLPAFSGVILAPFDIVQRIPFENIGNKLLLGNIDEFIEQLKLFQN
ncbi:glycosyl transferase [Cryptosporidium muris RN66]|uniref:Glycosyl transferase, group 1 family protein n=1 Tax=Cryptosporidium muris (strain RN66) TaxID=441375 RepID=B6ACJ9_CRYMR|nr:glycosyl transferase [Cryptosporidium muris RN66]EEA05853.1 glycosyl transferase, group 1 family protein [Cryptosporidium muris RN66]|eukprot:XP_002140202.1 glycosyl transferase [Cryptosporidium muris RN66]